MCVLTMTNGRTGGGRFLSQGRAARLSGWLCVYVCVESINGSGTSRRLRSTRATFLRDDFFILLFYFALFSRGSNSDLRGSILRAFHDDTTAVLCARDGKSCTRVKYKGEREKPPWRARAFAGFARCDVCHNFFSRDLPFALSLVVVGVSVCGLQEKRRPAPHRSDSIPTLEL